MEKPTKSLPTSTAFYLPEPPKHTHAESLLAWLHQFEFTMSPRIQWPWHRWQNAPTEHRRTFKAALLPLFNTPQKTGAEQALLVAARTIRLPETARADTPKGKQSPFIAHGSHVLNEIGPHAALEAMMIAFAETRFQEVEQISRELMNELVLGTRDLFDHAPSLQAPLYDLLLESWWFAVYRQGMSGYVDAPKALLIELERGLERWLSAAPAPVSLRTKTLLKANHQAMRGDIETALRLYVDTSRQIRPQSHQKTTLESPVLPMAHMIFPPPHAQDTAKANNWYKKQSKLIHHFTHLPAGKHAVLVSCDESYFREYGALFTALTAQRQPGTIIHFHLINIVDTTAITDILSHLSAACTTPINWSFEQNTLCQDKAERVREVASTARYIYLPEYLKSYASITISDLDGWIEPSLKDLTHFKDCDTLISSWIWRKNTGYWRLPWSNVSTGLFSIKASEQGHMVAAAIARYLVMALHKATTNALDSYFADQAALFLTLKPMAESGMVKMGFIGGGFKQSPDNSFHNRHASKKAAMQKELIRWQAQAAQHKTGLKTRS